MEQKVCYTEFTDLVREVHSIKGQIGTIKKILLTLDRKLA